MKGEDESGDTKLVWRTNFQLTPIPYIKGRANQTDTRYVYRVGMMVYPILYCNM